MNLDDKVCYCFHVTRRKLVNWVRLNAPQVPSQLSECGGAGTGCGWCIPFLRQIFRHGRTIAQNRLSRSFSERIRGLAPIMSKREGHSTPGGALLNQRTMDE